jgi:hypothetical protein
MTCNCDGNYLTGENVDVEFVFQDKTTGANIAMTTVTIFATPPTGASSIPLSVANPAVGVYTATFVVSSAGKWRAVATGVLTGKTRIKVLDVFVDTTPIVP